MENSPTREESNGLSDDREEHYYYPGGIPITPQARRLGYEFPVYVSHRVWAEACSWNGLSKFRTSTDLRIAELVQYCYDGMIKHLAVSDDFVYYPFKVWYWDRHAGVNTKKKTRNRFGARLFIDPNNDTPWLYIFDLKYDSNTLIKGEPPDGESTRDGGSDQGQPESEPSDGTGMAEPE